MGLIELIPDVRVGDRIWIDEDRNGLQDPGEEGVPGVMVTLYDTSTGDVIGTTTSDANGNYLFDELYPGDYYVEFDLSSIPSNYGVIAPDAGDDTLDSDVDPTTGQTPATGILFTGEENMSLDLGLYQIDNVEFLACHRSRPTAMAIISLRNCQPVTTMWSLTWTPCPMAMV